MTSRTKGSQIDIQGPKKVPKNQLEMIPDNDLLAEVARRLGMKVSKDATARRIVPKNKKPSD